MKTDGKNVQLGDLTPKCMGNQSGCKVNHCAYAQECWRRTKAAKEALYAE